MRNKQRNIVAALVGLAVVLVAARYFLTSRSAVVPRTPTLIVRHRSPAATPAPAVESPPILEIGADEWSWKRSDGSAVVSGRVRNISDGSLMNIVAEVSFYDEDGRFVTSAEAYLASNLIRAGQTVDFEIRTPWDPAFKEAKVGFQESMGEPIETRWKQPQ